MRKLYGHINDIVCLAISHVQDSKDHLIRETSSNTIIPSNTSTYLVSSCKSREAKTATLFVWNVGESRYSYLYL